MIKRFIARRRLVEAMAYHGRVVAAATRAVDTDAPRVVLEAYDSALVAAEDRWAAAVRVLAGVA